jgi:hypothetical protein
MGLDGEAIAKIQNYQRRSASLLLYQSVLESDIGLAFVALLNALTADALTADARADSKSDDKAFQGNRTLACHRAYGQWFAALATADQSWAHHLILQMLIADNAFSHQVQFLALNQGSQSQALQDDLSNHDLSNCIAPGVLAAVQHDLAILYELYHLPLEQLSEWTGQVCDCPAPPVMRPHSEPKLPVSFPYQPEWTMADRELAGYYRRHGVGIFGQFAALRWQSGAGNPSSGSLLANQGQLVGIPSPDPIRLSQLAAYEHPKQQLVQNTESLLRGYTAQNVLLYGARGAGKSSLVKALLNEYHSRGLRLVEVPKAELHHLPQIVEPLSRLPQKFIIFVDDLSFEEDNEAFKALKVVLEGGVTARPQNVVVYATSNRRHLIREFFDERPKPKDAEEIQAWDTVQEKLSFSDRFGLTLTFTPADQPIYLAIVRELAAQANLAIDPDNLDWRARQWATRHNGRSGRSARQFIDFLIAEQDD